MSRLLRLAIVDLRPLARRDFRLLFIGQLVSFLGSEVTFVAVPYKKEDKKKKKKKIQYLISM